MGYRPWGCKQLDTTEQLSTAHLSISWTVKKAEHLGIDAFKLWCWRSLLRVPCTARILYQSILKVITTEYSLDGWLLKLKLQYLGHLMQRFDSLEKTNGKDWRKKKWGDRGWDSWIALQTQWKCLSTLWEIVKDREAWHAVVYEVSKSQTWLSDWTTTNLLISCFYKNKQPTHS